MSYVYQQTSSGGGFLSYAKWQVGFYTPDGEWIAESEYTSWEAAAERVRHLNGGN